MNKQPRTNNQEPTRTNNKFLALATGLGFLVSSWGVSGVSAAPLLENKGSLSLGDNVFADGRLYDSYNFEALAGELVTVASNKRGVRYLSLVAGLPK